MKKLTIPCFILLIGYGAVASAQFETIRYSKRYIKEGCPTDRVTVVYKYKHRNLELTRRDAGVVRSVRYFK